MMNKRALVASAMAVALAGLGAVSAVVPAAAAANCQEWQDRNTYGVKCSDAGRYYGWARCRDGRFYSGPTVSSGWSYVYCAGRGGLIVGEPTFV